MTTPTRRGIIQTAAGLGVAALAGCMVSGSKQPRYRLEASNIPGTLAEHFRWQARGEFPEADRRLMTELTNAGSLVTAGFGLFPPGRDGPSYVERDGTFYEITIREAGQVTREHWILWFDLIEGEPPADVETYTSSLGVGGGTDLAAEYGLSPLDVTVVENAAGEIPREGNFHDPEGEPPGRRGHVFLRRDADDTALLPDPPFTHVAFETGEDTRYARVVTERARVQLQQFEHTARPIAPSEEQYQEYIHETYLQTTFNPDSLTSEQRKILDTITAGGGRYSESAPLSDAFEAVLSRLGLSEISTPEAGSVAFSEPAYFRYRESFYGAELQIFR